MREKGDLPIRGIILEIYLLGIKEKLSGLEF